MSADLSKEAHEERLARIENGTACDDDRRLVRFYERQARSAEYDRRSDAERARQEEANDEAPGTRGRNFVGRVDPITGQAVPVGDVTPDFEPGADQEDVDRQRVAQSGAGVNSSENAGNAGDTDGGVTSAGRSTPASSEPATPNDENSKQDPPSSARTTGLPFSKTLPGSSGAPSTGGSGPANQ